MGSKTRTINKHKITSWEQYRSDYDQSIEDPQKFWDSIADDFIWEKRWKETLNGDLFNGKNKWFIDGQLNITENCIDRHLKHNADKPAIIWESNDIDKPNRTITYKELLLEVSKIANILKELGVRKGDRVCIYMPMIPETTFAMLACARIGAIHCVVFAGFSSTSLKERINDSQCQVILTCDGMKRGDKDIYLKKIVDEALIDAPTIRKCLVLRNIHCPVNFVYKRDIWWDEEVNKAQPSCQPVMTDSEDPLFILYTSGSTGKPKGVVHTVAGYMVYSYYTFLNVFQYCEDDIYWCTADIGWITGHTYTVYGPLLNGCSIVMFEGIPTWPDPGRFWDICQKYSVTKFYTAPTAIRSLMSFGEEYVDKHDLNSLKILGSVGEPLNEEAWHWYNEQVGKKKCPIVDTWWQTETGGICISPIPYLYKNKPSYVMFPLPGIQPILVDNAGNEISEPNKEGFLCIKFPWPGIIRTTYNNHKRCVENYFEKFPGLYFTGDACKMDEDGHYRIIGRVDDVINVSGHRLGTAEIESAINEHKDIVESAVVGSPHPIKGQSIVAFVACKNKISNKILFDKELKDIVARIISPIAKPEKIIVCETLPKTRSGKIMRRILRIIVEGERDDFGDISTLIDASVVKELIENYKKCI